MTLVVFAENGPKQKKGTRENMEKWKYVSCTVQEIGEQENTAGQLNNVQRFVFHLVLFSRILIYISIVQCYILAAYRISIPGERVVSDRGSREGKSWLIKRDAADAISLSRSKEPKGRH